ncbi:hypothetical protein RND71_005845 [Anisodus tanguticus]|uniref:Uncharacterized protein n=1 Tax=Anisodus tanguticus TaxID=243964 RepID=A0AAE1ST87_9SOLA|nr:hypothetical protein RND71_005845 [Anisodus tanguticus]
MPTESTTKSSGIKEKNFDANSDSDGGFETSPRQLHKPHLDQQYHEPYSSGTVPTHETPLEHAPSLQPSLGCSDVSSLDDPIKDLEIKNTTCSHFSLKLSQDPVPAFNPINLSSKVAATFMSLRKFSNSKMISSILLIVSSLAILTNVEKKFIKTTNVEKKLSLRLWGPPLTWPSLK